MQEPEYYNQNQVKLTKEIAAFITEDLTMHYTIEQLSERFGISMTTLKKGFHGVYGTSVYSWLRNYRMQTAQKLLLETELSVAEIAHQVGYLNPCTKLHLLNLEIISNYRENILLYFCRIGSVQGEKWKL